MIATDGKDGRRRTHGVPRLGVAATWQKLALLIVVLVLLVVSAMYVTTHELAPRLFTHSEHAPQLAALPKRTVNGKGVAADPINVAIVGSRDEVIDAMKSGGWTIADSATRHADIAIARSVLFNQPDSAAPISPLYLFGRSQDMAFEREVGPSARRRHHVRLWLAPGTSYSGRAVWLGDATFDLRAGISHRGPHPTHHIAPDIDQERDTLVANLIGAQKIDTLFTVTGLGIRIDSHNAEGDRFDTDGESAVVVLAGLHQRAAHVDTLPAPRLVVLKDRLWMFSHRHW